MLLKLESNRPKFKTVVFRPGLNLIVAGVGKASAKGNTRNGRGKSSLIEVLSFCLGGSDPKEPRTLAKPRLAGSCFSLSMKLRGEVVKASRCLGAKEIYIDGVITDPIHKLRENDFGYFFTIPEWRDVLGDIMFGVEPTDSPLSFRSLISYFVRDGKGAYVSPERTMERQSPRVTRVNHAKLFGFPWRDQKALEDARKEKDLVQSSLKTLKGGILDIDGVSVSKLRSKESSIEDRAEELQRRIECFSVHESYSEIESEASDITSEIHDLSHANIGDAELVRSYQEQRSSEVPPSIDELERIYSDVGIAFPDEVKQTLADATNFHETIVSDRLLFFENEIVRLEKQIDGRRQKIEGYDNRRQSLMRILRTHGALDEYNALQGEYQLVRDQLAQVRDRIGIQAGQEQRLVHLKAEAAQIAANISDQVESLDGIKHYTHLQRLFRDASKKLYGKAKGVIDFNSDDKGIEITVGRVDRAGSDGIESANLLTHDLVMAKYWAEQGQGPGFLVHDSRLYDPIDTRQRKEALVLAEQWASESKLQYVTMFNSDMLPVDLYDEKGVGDECVVLEFSDKGSTGGLFGELF